MERIANKAISHQAARRWDIEQNRKMTPEERQLVARELKRRAYGTNNPDVREAERSR